MSNLVIFEDKKVSMLIHEEEVLFELYSVGQAIGYERSNGKSTGEQGVHPLYPYKSRIDKVIMGAGIEPVVHSGQLYLTEEMLYDFIFEARTDKAKSFRKWISNEVLPQIRATGAYISDNITDKQQELLFKYGMPRYRKHTFTTVPVEQIQLSYKECMEYNKRRDIKKKNLIRKEIVRTLEEREQVAISNGSAPLALLVAEEVKSIQKDITSSSNRSNGAKIGKANREILSLQEQINQLEPLPHEWNTIDYHGFSVNCCTIAVGDKIVGSSPYNTWKRNFPADKLPCNEFDFNNPIFIWLEFDHKASLDVSNLHKTFIDKLCKHYVVDDQYVQLMRCRTRNYVDKYEEGKIHFAIREGVWE